MASAVATQWLGGLALAALAALLYAKVLHAPFVYDDLINIVQQGELHWRRFDPAAWAHSLFVRSSTRPVALASFGLNHFFGGLRVEGYHAVNIAIHALNGCLVMLLARTTYDRLCRLQGQAAAPPARHWIPLLALLAGALFVAHPLQTQSVSYVVQRMNSLAAGFSLLALLLYLWGRESRTGTRRALLWAGAALAWVCGLGSKETALVVPFAAALYEWFFLRDLDPRWGKRAFVALSGATLLAAVAGIVFVQSSGFDLLAPYPEKDFGPLQRVLTQLRVVFFYASLVLLPLPSRMSLLHVFETSTSLVAPLSTLACALLLLALGVLAIRCAPRHRLLSFALSWFALFLALESSFLPLSMAMEHRTYLPLAGPCLLAAWWVGSVLRAQPFAALALGLALVTSLGAGTLVRNAAWKNAATLWRDVLDKYPDLAAGHHNLGYTLYERGRHGKALSHQLRVIELSPQDAKAHHNLAETLRKLGRDEDAIRSLRIAVRLDSGLVEARRALVGLLLARGESAAAIEELEALWEFEASERAGLALGAALSRAGRTDEAQRHYEDLVRREPGSLRAHLQLSALLAQAGEDVRARAHRRRAAALARQVGLEARGSVSP